MARVIKGTKDLKNYQVLKGSSDIREIRCTNQKCRNVACKVPDGKGGSKYKCLACGTVFSFTQI